MLTTKEIKNEYIFFLIIKGKMVYKNGKFYDYLNGKNSGIITSTALINFYHKYLVK